MPVPLLGRFWIGASSASCVLRKIRTLEERCNSLLGSNSELSIFHEQDLVRPITEALRIDETLVRILPGFGIEGRQNVESDARPAGPQSLTAKSPGRRKANSTAQRGQAGDVDIEPVLIAAATTRTTEPGSTWSGTSGLEARASRKEPELVSNREQFSISRAEARAQFNEISDYAGVRSAWDKFVVATSNTGQTREGAFASAPGPGPRRFRRLASSAGDVTRRTLEEKWASLFKSSSDLSIFHEQSLIRDDRRIVQSPAAAYQAPTTKTDAVAEAKTNSLRNESTRNDSAGEKVYASRQAMQRVSEHKKLSVTRAQARDYFNEISERAGVRSSWDQFVVENSGGGPNDEQSSVGASSTQAVRSALVRAKARIHSKVTRATGIRILDRAPLPDDEAPRASRLDQILRPLVERMIHTPPRLSRTRIAKRELPDGSYREDETNLTQEQPRTGLRRLAEMAVNVADVPAIQRDRKTIADNERMPSGISELLQVPQVARSEAEFASQVTEFLRQEMLRHGIGLEGS